MNTSNRSRSVETISRILSLFSTEKGEVGIREASQSLGVYPSRVHRLLSSLEGCGLLEKGLDRKYRLGERIFELGSLYPHHLPLRKIARPHAEELAKRFKTNVQLAVPSRMRPCSVIIIDRIINLQSPSFIQRLSLNVPMHCCAVGKCILAFMPAEKRKRALKEMKLVPFTKNTITNIRNLEAQLSRIKKNGFAVDQGEIFENVNCVGAPIFQNEDLVGSLSLTDTADRINPANFQEMAEALMAKSVFISRQL